MFDAPDGPWTSTVYPEGGRDGASSHIAAARITPAYGRDPMTGPDNVAPLPRPVAEAEADRLRLGLAILQHRPFCRACRPHVRDAVRALAGESIEDIADRGGR